MAASGENQINLKTLQRVDSNIVEIIDNACQVAIYKYESKLEKWEGTDIEGALFLYRRSLYPYHGFIIVNRMSTTNFVESITSDMQFQLQEPYLLYKNHSGDIIGSWFYEHKDLQRISKKIQTIMLKQVPQPKRQRCASESETFPQNDTQSQDIMTLLSEAHEEYIKKASNIKTPEKNCKDVNNLSTYLEKKSLEKSVCSSKNKHENSGTFHSFDENFSLSPRRRFMSTGSVDSSQVNYLSRMFSAVQLTTIPSPEVKKNNVVKNCFVKESSDHCNMALNRYESSPPKQLSSFFNHDQKNSPVLDASAVNKHSDSHFEDYCLDKKEPSFQSNQNWRNATNENSNAHFASIKDAIKSHIQENPKVMLKIHEAYVSSLKSLFAKSSC